MSRRNVNTYRIARAFGRGRLFSAWVQVRYWLTGRTGRYRVKLNSKPRKDRGEQPPPT